MDHLDALTLMGDALDGRLRDDQERELALHLVGCADCKADYDTLGRAVKAIGTAVQVRPSSDAVDVAVTRASAILVGEADPGSQHTIDIEPDGGSGEGVQDETGPLEIPPADGPPLLADDALGPAIADEAIDHAPAIPPAPPPWTPDGATGDIPVVEDDEPDVIVVPAGGSERDQAPFMSEADIGVDDPRSALDEESPDWFAEPGPEREPELPPVYETPPLQISSGIQETLNLPASDEPLGYDVLPAKPEAGPKLIPWALGIAAAIALAALAGFLVARGPGGGDGGGGDVPSASRVRDGVESAFADLRSLKTSFSVSRLGLWRMREREGRTVFSFSVGTTTGRFVFDGTEGYRQETTLQVQDTELDRSKLVVTADQVRRLEGAGSDATLTIASSFPLGPPDGELVTGLGVMEQYVTSATRMLLDASDLRVVERVTRDDRAAYRVRFSTTPDAATRADRIEMLIDARTFVPVEVRRSIGRGDAQVLGPPEILGADALDAAFEQRDRVTTELVELENVVVDDVILPGEFVLDASTGVQPESVDGGFERTTRAGLEDAVDFDPLLPTELPGGYRDFAYAVRTDDLGAWGPDDRYPAPDAIVHSAITDGRTTIVITQRHQPDGPFDVSESPLEGAGIPLETRSVVRGGHRFVYAVSGDTPPHVFGFVGSVFVVVSGYAPADDLLRVAGSLAADAREPSGSPVATTSP